MTILLSLLKSTGVVSNFPMSNLSTLLFKLLKLLGTFFNLSISNLSTSDFKLAKSVFKARSNAPSPAFFNLFMLHSQKNLNQLLHLLLNNLDLENIHSFILSILSIQLLSEFS